MRPVVPAALAVVGGSLLFVGGVEGSLGLLGFLLHLLSGLAPAPIDAVLFWLMMVLGALASSGGATVIAGALLIGRGRLTTGKFLLRLGCGTGLLGFAFQLALRAMRGIEHLTAFLTGLAGTTGGVGVLICLASMLLARKPKPPDVEKPEAPVRRMLRPPVSPERP